MADLWRHKRLLTFALALCGALGLLRLLAGLAALCALLLRQEVLAALQLQVDLRLHPADSVSHSHVMNVHALHSAHAPPLPHSRQHECADACMHASVGRQTVTVQQARLRTLLGCCGGGNGV